MGDLSSSSADPVAGPDAGGVEARGTVEADSL
jgi:hypothetical protein